MSQISPLDRIIKRLPTTNQQDATHDDAKVYFYEEASRRVEERLGPFSKFFKDYRAYSVSRQDEIEWEGPTVVLRELTDSRKLPIQTRFRIACEPGEEKKLVKALAAGATPSKRLGDLVTRWVREFVRERREAGVDFVDNFNDEVASLEQRLVDRALKEVGLRTECAIEGPQDPKLTEIQSEPFSVRVKDSVDKLAISFEAELSVLEDREIAASTRVLDVIEIETALREEIQRYFRAEVGLHQFHTELGEGITDRISVVLNQMLGSSCRRLSFFALSTTAASIPPGTVEVEHAVKCTIKDANEKVGVENTLLLRLEDEALWKKAKFVDLDSWYRQTLDEVIKDRLFDRTYVDLVLDFAKDEETIKGEVAQQAGAVGYAVKHHLVVPNLEPIRIRDEGFDASSENNYATSDSRHEVGLELIVTGHVPDLRKIEHLLTPDTKIEPLMRDAVRDVTQKLLHEVPPFVFYLHFKSKGKNGEPSLEENLRNVIVSEVETRFHATDIRVIPKILVTSLLERIADLCKVHHGFEMAVEPFRPGQGVTEVIFEGSFEVTGVSERGWHKFLSRDYGSIEDEIEAARQILSTEMRTKLATVPARYLSYEKWGDWQQLAERIFSNSAQVVERALGLDVRLISFGRRRTEAERLTGEVELYRIQDAAEGDKAATKLIRETRLEEFKQLEGRRSKLLPDDPQMEVLDERLKQLREDLMHLPEDFGAQRLIEGGASEEEELEDYGDTMLSLRGSAVEPRQLESVEEDGQ